jgi:hypothetical protein
MVGSVVGYCRFTRQLVFLPFNDILAIMGIISLSGPEIPVNDDQLLLILQLRGSSITHSLEHFFRIPENFGTLLGKLNKLLVVDPLLQSLQLFIPLENLPQLSLPVAPGVKRAQPGSQSTAQLQTLIFSCGLLCGRGSSGEVIAAVVFEVGSVGETFLHLGVGGSIVVQYFWRADAEPWRYRVRQLYNVPQTLLFDILSRDKFSHLCTLAARSSWASPKSSLTHREVVRAKSGIEATKASPCLTMTSVLPSGNVSS